jgi:diguanylate cyclase (GGDEF)-like protein
LSDDEARLAMAMRQEDPKVAKSIALAILGSAVAKTDRHLEGRVLTLLAQCENLLANSSEAYELSSRALPLLQSAKDVREEAKALAVLCRSSSALGRNDQAIEGGLLMFELAKRTGDAASQADAQSQLGKALFHAGCFDAARQHLREARCLAQAGSSPLELFTSIVIEGVCELMSLVTERHETGRVPPLHNLLMLLELHADFSRRHDIARDYPDEQPIQATWKLVSSAAHCWMGGIAEAERELESVRSWLDRYDRAPSMKSLEAFVRCEVAQARGDWLGAEESAARMIELAEQTGREQAALVGHLLMSRVLELQGEPQRALVELKKLAARQRRIRSETLASRSTVVSWQLEMRRSEESRRALQATAQELERLALEDAMTGIANRRCFERVVARRLQASRTESGRAVCLALIDVDRFKQVNDGHSHLVGDKVLQVIAALLTEHVRADDLAARLAGDEFVLLLCRTDLAEAMEICERVRRAVAAYKWSAISPGLNVTISLGVAQSRPGDTLESLMHRSDVAMYERKRISRPRQRGVKAA